MRVLAVVPRPRWPVFYELLMGVLVVVAPDLALLLNQASDTGRSQTTTWPPKQVSGRDMLITLYCLSKKNLANGKYYISV